MWVEHGKFELEVVDVRIGLPARRFRVVARDVRRVDLQMTSERDERNGVNWTNDAAVGGVLCFRQDLVDEVMCGVVDT